MTDSHPLLGQHILVTRPQPAAHTLAQLIEKQGGTAACFPVIQIVPEPQHPSTIQALQQLPRQHHIIFTSAHAAQAVLAQHAWPTSKATLYAIGPATATACAQHGLTESILPEEHNSDSLLTQQGLQQVAGQYITIFCGQNPKPVLADTLTQRGAHVTLAYCYRRDIPPPPTNTEWAQLLSENYQAIITTSSEGLDNLVTLFTQHLNWLQQQQLIVVRDHAIQQATDYGFQKTPWLSPDASHTAILNTLKKQHRD